MDIKTSEQLQETILLAENGNKEILYDIARYIAYNYYMYCHVKRGSEQDLSNEIIYKQFQKNSPELYEEVECQIDTIYDCD